RCAVPASKRVTAQRDVQQAPSFEVRTGGGAARVEIALVEVEHDRIRCLAADRELDLQLLAIERKALRIVRGRKLGAGAPGQLDLTIWIEAQAEARVARAAALIDDLDLRHPERRELRLRLGTAEHARRIGGLRSRPAQAEVLPAQAQIHGRLERCIV